MKICILKFKKVTNDYYEYSDVDKDSIKIIDNPSYKISCNGNFKDITTKEKLLEDISLYMETNKSLTIIIEKL